MFWVLDWFTQPKGRVSINGRMFFSQRGLHAVVETEAHGGVALVFGGAWLVNSAVFFTVLVLILLANLYPQGTTSASVLVLLCRPAGVPGGRRAGLALNMFLSEWNAVALCRTLQRT